MKKHLSILFALCLMGTMSMRAELADWYFYIWSDTYSLDGDAGQFETTDDPNVFVIASCAISAQGINFGVHNKSWSAIYGWGTESVTETGKDVALASSNVCNGWWDLPAGSYKVTFNASALTVRFDEPDSQGGNDDPEPSDETYPDHSSARQFLRGADLTMATYIEDWGATFRYEDGTAGDLFAIMEHYGVNLARLRLYNNPGTGIKYSGGDQLYRMPIQTTAHPEGYPYAGPDDIFNLAKRAKAHGMQICLSIYLSDYWSGATEQYIPAAWKDVTSNDVLADSVYNFVYAYMSRLAAANIYPEYVSVGNESNYGILYTNLNGSKVNFGGHTGNIAQCVKLFNKAYDAIKAVAPDAQVIIHHSYGDAGKIGVCRSFFQTLSNNGCKYDIVGGSYYPHWSHDHNAASDTPEGSMLPWAKDMEQNIGKPVMIMEAGYSWDPYKCPERNGGNWAGQLGTNGSYNEATPKGQRDFLCALHDAIASDEKILGYMYWDPIFIDQKVNGSWIKTCWAEKYDAAYDAWWEDGNVISNTTWFDYTGQPLPALYQEVASRALPKDNPSTDVSDRNPAVQACDALGQPAVSKVLLDGELYILRDGALYSLTGVRRK